MLSGQKERKKVTKKERKRGISPLRDSPLVRGEAVPQSADYAAFCGYIRSVTGKP